MQTSFTLAQLADPDVAEADKILRACVHCGFCTATCPTYVLLGDELDSPRGRIYLIKDMLENDRPATGEVVKHIDRCLSCLACMTTCPSGVHYMHLVDHARAHVEETYSRPLARPGDARAARRGAALSGAGSGCARFAGSAAGSAACLAPLLGALSVSTRASCRRRLAGSRRTARCCADAAAPTVGTRAAACSRRRARAAAASRCCRAARNPCSRPRSTRRRSGC